MEKKTKMKADDKWSSVDAVLNSFNNVSIMGNAGKGRNDDLFASPSPPKHRISPSQLALLKETLGFVTPESKKPVSPMGRAERLVNHTPRYTVLERNNIIAEVIKSNKTVDYSNASIEHYYNSICQSSSSDFEDADELNDSETSSQVDTSGKASVESDQVSINSNLNADAVAFYPKGTASSIPSSNVLDCSNLVDHKSPVLKGKSKPEPAHIVGTNLKNGFRKYNSNDDNTKDSLKQTDKHITFGVKHHEYLEKNQNDPVDYSLPSCSSVSPTISANNQPLKAELTIPAIPSPSPVKVNDEPAKPRQKRVMKNALFMSLPQKQSVELKTPQDFLSSSLSNSTFLPISNSNLELTSSESDGIQDTDLSESYDFSTDPTIDSATRDLLMSLTSSPSCSVEPSSQSSSPIRRYVSRSSKNLKGSGCPKPLSSFNYKYQDTDFPPLL